MTTCGLQRIGWLFWQQWQLGGSEGWGERVAGVRALLAAGIKLNSGKDFKCPSHYGLWQKAVVDGE